MKHGCAGGARPHRNPRPRRDGEGEAPAWVAEFLAGLIVNGSVVKAVEEAGIEYETAWALREREPEFALYWDRAVGVHRKIAAGIPFAEAVGANL